MIQDLTEVFERLVAANIQILPLTGVDTHFVFERGGFAALVERRGDGLGGIGASGLLTEHGFAVLIWRSEQPFFVARGFEQPATPEQIESVRAFAAELKAALQNTRS